MNEREMIEQRCKEEGFTILGWDEEHENGLTAKLGTFVVTTDDFEDSHGLFDGDEGELTACVVGAEQYHNQRVSFSFIAEGTASGNDVPELWVLEPVDA